VGGFPWEGLHLAAAAVTGLLLARLGGACAKLLRQPRVIGEIAVGLAVGPVLVALAGTGGLDRLLPVAVFDWLKLLAEAGLVLFLVGMAQAIRPKEAGLSRRSVVWVTTGSFLIPLFGGALLAAGLLLWSDASVHGDASRPALVIYLAVALSVTAVPVLARILEDRGLMHTGTGSLALAAAVFQDIAGWLLLSVAVGLSAGTTEAVWRSLTVFAVGTLGAVALRLVLRTKAVSRLFTEPVAAVTLAVLALAAALASESLGLTAIFGAVLVGAAVPRTAGVPWAGAVSAVTRFGRRLVPLFFVTTGVTVFTSVQDTVSWPLITLVTLLGFVCKVGGGYLGARLGARNRWDALRIGALMDTRGLTELVVLAVGYKAGILTVPLYLALVVMALVTTVLTGPGLSAIQWAERRAGQAVEPPAARTTV
jgi:Kef-type K+ transport system membrane component KefB